MGELPRSARYNLPMEHAGQKIRLGPGGEQGGFELDLAHLACLKPCHIHTKHQAHPPASFAENQSKQVEATGLKSHGHRMGHQIVDFRRAAAAATSCKQHRTLLHHWYGFRGNPTGIPPNKQQRTKKGKGKPLSDW